MEKVKYNPTFSKAENKAYLEKELNNWLKFNCRTFYNLIKYNKVSIVDSMDLNYLLFEEEKEKMMKTFLRIDNLLDKFEKYQDKYNIKNIDKERQERYKKRIYKAIELIDEKQNDLLYKLSSNKFEYQFCNSFQKEYMQWSMRKFKDALDSCGNIKK